MKNTLLAALAASAIGIAPAALQAQSLPSLVNVNLENVLNDLAIKLNIDRTNIPVTAQVPVQIAANVCGVSLLSFNTGNTTCTATTAPQTLVQAVQQQMAAGGNATGGTGGSTGSTGGGSTGGTTGGSTGGTTGGSTGGTTGGSTGGTTGGNTGGTTGGSTGGTTGGNTGGTTGGNTGGTTGGNTGGTNDMTTFRNRGQCQSTLVQMRNAARKGSRSGFSKSCQTTTDANGRTVYVIQ